jgi:phosphatidylglycerol:prolipoprotein diacylglycerol transferase
MFPTIIKIGPFSLRSYGLMVALGLFIALQYLVSAAKKKGISQEKVMDIVLYAIVAGLIGARAAYVLTNWGFYSRNIGDIFKIWEGGLVYYGGLIAGTAAVVVFARLNKEIDIWELGDVVMPAVSLGHVFGRIGCLLAGCCYGLPTTLPWGIRFSNPEALAPAGVCLHPTQLYEAFGNLIVFAALDRFNKAGHRKGQAIFAYVFLYGALRFVMEFFRGDDRGPSLSVFSQAQVISIVMVVIAAALFWARYLRGGADK